MENSAPYFRTLIKKCEINRPAGVVDLKQKRLKTPIFIGFPAFVPGVGLEPTRG